jgi:hypothetical protein
MAVRKIMLFDVMCKMAVRKIMLFELDLELKKEQGK